MGYNVTTKIYFYRYFFLTGMISYKDTLVLSLSTGKLLDKFGTSYHPVCIHYCKSTWLVIQECIHAHVHGLTWEWQAEDSCTLLLNVYIAIIKILKSFTDISLREHIGACPVH